MDLASGTLKYCLLSDLADERVSQLTNSFSCSNHTIDQYLKNEAYLDHYEFKANTTLVFANDNFIGYFTSKQDTIKIATDDRNCLSIERLGIQTECQRKGSGSTILKFIVAMAEMFNQRYITIDSVWEYREFYFDRGFCPFIPEEYNQPNETGLVYMFIDLYDEEKVSYLYDNP